MKFTQTLKSVFPSSVTKYPRKMSILSVVNFLPWSRESKVVLEMCSCYQKVRQLSKMSYRGKKMLPGVATIRAPKKKIILSWAMSL